MKSKNLILFLLLSLAMSCNNKILIKDDSSNSQVRTIDKKAIKELKFEPTYYCTTKLSKRIISTNLENLKSKLLAWDKNVVLNNKEFLTMIKETIINLNKENEKGDFVQTDEREWICSELVKIAVAVKYSDIKEFNNHIDIWRNW